jgi:sporulation protein YlmC with PRC-barrel domain
MMSQRTVTTISSLAILVLTAGVPHVLAQQQEAPQPGAQQSAPQQARQGEQTFNRIPVVAGSDIIGKPVRDKDGLLIGEAEYLMINPASGRIARIVLGSGTTLADQFRLDGLRAIPWEQVDRSFYNRGEIRTLSLRIPRNAVENAPKVDTAAIEALTSPSYQMSVRNYYLPIAPSEETEQQGQPGDATGSTTAPDAQAGTQGSTQPQQPDSQTNAPTAGQGHSEPVDGTAPPEGFVLLGRSVITALMPPNFQLSQDMRGAAVMSADGQELGEIMRLAIDAQRGRVAYALVSFGGFLGSGSEVRAVPIQALAWQENGTFRLNINAATYGRMPRIDPDRFPSSVARSDIEKLYQAFGVKPYWESPA